MYVQKVNMLIQISFMYTTQVVHKKSYSFILVI